MVTATDTTSSTLARIFELLAQHPTVQERLRAEVIDAWQDGDITYGRLMQLPYLDAVFRETMRLSVHPAYLLCAVSTIYASPDIHLRIGSFASECATSLETMAQS